MIKKNTERVYIIEIKVDEREKQIPWILKRVS